MDAPERRGVRVMATSGPDSATVAYGGWCKVIKSNTVPISLLVRRTSGRHGRRVDRRFRCRAECVHGAHARWVNAVGLFGEIQAGRQCCSRLKWSAGTNGVHRVAGPVVTLESGSAPRAVTANGSLSERTRPISRSASRDGHSGNTIGAAHAGLAITSPSLLGSRES